MIGLSRTAFMAASGASLLVRSPVRAEGLTRIRLSGSPDDDIIAALWGIQSGIFTKLGLDVDLQTANSGAAISAAVIGGALDVGKSSLLPLLGAHLRGVSFFLQAPAAIWNTNAPRSALVISKTSSIRNGHDLNGKTVSVPALGDLYQVSISAWIDQHGGDSRTVKFLELPHRAAAESINAGRVDAANIAEPILNDAIKSGKCKVLGHAQDAIAKHFISTAYFCTADYAAKNVDALARFRRGLYQAGAYANAHRSELIPVIAKYSGVDPEIIASMTPNIVATSSKDLNAAAIQPLIALAAKYGALSAAFNAKEMLDPNAL
jgi:NitT/TauT family transport system substrate-binding protein